MKKHLHSTVKLPGQSTSNFLWSDWSIAVVITGKRSEPCTTPVRKCVFVCMRKRGRVFPPYPFVYTMCLPFLCVCVCVPMNKYVCLSVFVCALLCMCLIVPVPMCLHVLFMAGHKCPCPTWQQVSRCICMFAHLCICPTKVWVMLSAFKKCSSTVSSLPAWT